MLGSTYTYQFLATWGHMWGSGAGGWVFGILMMAFWIALAAVVVYLLVRALSHGGTGGTGGPYPDRETPLDIARRRYAAGEISTEQLAEIEKTLKGG